MPTPTALTRRPSPARDEAAALPTADEIAGFLARLGQPVPTTDDADLVDRIAALEQLKSAAAAAQARLTAAFDRSQRAEQAAHDVPNDKLGAGVAAQVALARRDSPVRGGRHLGFARALVDEMPHTLAALTAGLISEWRATIVVRETAHLSREHRGQVDAELAGRLGELGDRGVERAARTIGYRLDPAAAMRRRSRAEADRRVTIRPAPDTMSLVTALLPVAQGVAVHAALTRHADALRATGDPRSRGQAMADTFVERLTGQATADAVPVEVQLVMTDGALLSGDDTPATIVGHGPVPASLARALVRGADTETGATARDAQVWLRRLYTAPGTGDLVALDSRRRVFPEGLRRFLVLRDEFCRTPWCDAPIRHADHVVPAGAGGATSADNGQGLCERCNYAKEAPGWRADTVSSGTSPPVLLTTPTGHRYSSRAPTLRGRERSPAPTPSVLEDRFADLIAAA